MKLEFHPYANLFELIVGSEFEDLVQDIRTYGVREKGRLFQGMILDGRNRYLASAKACVDMEFSEFVGDDDDALAYVLSTNLYRRHLTESQRSMVGADLVDLPRGRPKDNSATLPNKPGEPPPSSRGVRQVEAARQVRVSTRLITSAKAVKDKAIPELNKAVRQGVITVSAAAQAATFAPEKQREIVAKAEEGKANVVRSVIKQEKRAVREVALAKKQSALPNKLFGFVWEDPAWQTKVYSRETGLDRAADNHYPTMTFEAICALPVKDIGAPDSIYGLWTTVPFLAHAMKLIEVRGYEYKSQFIWSKDKVGTGYWNRNKHEIFLIATRGKVPAPAPGTQWESVIEAPVGAHSEKPDLFYELIEDYFPNLEKIELNARRARKGWYSWGKEAPDAENQDIHLPVEEEVQDVISSPAKVVDEATHGTAVDELDEGLPEAIGVNVETASRLPDGRTSEQTSAPGVTGGERAALNPKMSVAEFSKRFADADGMVDMGEGRMLRVDYLKPEQRAEFVRARSA